MFYESNSSQRPNFRSGEGVGEMKHKIGITVLAAVLALAGLSEASQQFDTLKSSVSDWTRTSILGNLLVFASDGAGESGAPQQQPTLLLAETRLACRGEKSHSAASRPASTTKAASADRAKQIEGSSRAHSIDELAMRFAATRDLNTPSAKSREQIVVKVAPQIAELAKELGEVSEDEAAGAVRARETGEARAAARVRAAAELKKLGVKRVFVRVARFSDAETQKKVFTFRQTESLPTMSGVWSLASLGDEPTPVVAPHGAPLAPTAPTTSEGTFVFQTNFNAPPASNTSFNCDSDPLG
jgi:hypothetical protein